MSKKNYNFEQWETRYRPYWQEIGLYRTGTDPEKPKHYILDYFPYPSGDGLSLGHCRNYVPTCVSTRYLRRKGYNVLHPMGWDAFGLPAENYAIRFSRHPRETTAQQAANYKRQLQLVECAYDWEKEINSTDPDYYRWTQWFFKLLFDRGLAYQAYGSQWWCPDCQTILANEQVEDGHCWRCDSEVVKREMKQWYFRITNYADELLADLELVDWPEPIKQMQRNWIGRSEGTTIQFQAGDQTIPVFTTRPDTLFGVTFLSIAPEHPLVGPITTAAQREAVGAYVAISRRRSEIDRLATSDEKSGVFSGAYATHPLTGAAVPIWIADYVLPGYGSGAVMGVPAHDSRDFAFAARYELPVVQVVTPEGAETTLTEAYTAYGVLVNSGRFTGLASHNAIEQINDELTARGQGRREISYKMRDWLISRQRYWGAPIPIVHCESCGPVAVPESDLPVRLPEIADYAPAGDGRSPLAKVDDWVNTTCPTCGGPARRETDTMDGFACSSWYFLRFPNPDYENGAFDPEAVRYWLPVDTYVGGAEHAVMHLLYARFWTKVLHDAGHINFVEP
ncbi:MAG: leucine--tRNA ligase, partial [Anaerolineales bacterium]|nr:leucine--tRNA ligase [Anaerolineales bacterium]